jgi:hypothetical protein
MATHLELGLDTFGDITTGPDGQLLHARSSATSSTGDLADTSVSISSASANIVPTAASAPDVVLAASPGAPAACVSARR